MAAIHLVTQEHSSSGLPVYLRDGLTCQGHNVAFIDAQMSRLARLGVLVRSFHPDKKKWFRLPVQAALQLDHLGPFMLFRHPG